MSQLNLLHRKSTARSLIYRIDGIEQKKQQNALIAAAEHRYHKYLTHHGLFLLQSINNR